MNKSKAWIKRKLFTFEFKGRPRRGLLWRKSIYEEWFYCAKHALAIGLDLPKDFTDVSSFESFEEWWSHPDKGFELFCEPFIENHAMSVDSQCNLTDDEILLKVNVNGDPDIILHDIKIALKPLVNARYYESRAKYKPSREMKYLRKKSITLSRRVWELSEQGLKQIQIVKELDLQIGDTLEATETALRKVQRAKARFNQSLRNVEQGTFP